MASAFPRIYGSPDEAPSDPPQNFVSLATVGQEENDPSRAFLYIDSSGQALVECTLQPDGDKIQAFLCLSQSGPSAGGFVPVAYGDTVVIVWPDSDYSNAYIVARVNNADDPLAPTVAGISTTGPSGQVRLFRWLVTPAGQVYAIAPTGELLLIGGASGVKVEGEQILLNGPTHIGADFASPPVPGQVSGGSLETDPTPAGPYVPPQGSTLTTPAFVGNANAIVRVLDGVQSNAATDPVFWTWKQALGVYLAALDVYVQALATLNPVTIAAALGVYQAALLAFSLTPDPTEIESQHKSASATHTCLD